MLLMCTTKTIGGIDTQKICVIKKNNMSKGNAKVISEHKQAFILISECYTKQIKRDTQTNMYMHTQIHTYISDTGKKNQNKSQKLIKLDEIKNAI